MIPRSVNLEIDPDRMEREPAGVPIRAHVNGHWGTFDIVHLKKDSLIEWLRSRDGANPWMEYLVLALLGHPR